jgi:hypothetical protein
MRLKFLTVILGFLTVSIAISSCLDSNDPVYDYSTDATIHAFGLDSIHGRHYKFTIDQLQGLVYNTDSLPVGADTILKHILIDTLDTYSGYVTISDTSTYVTTDSFDLRNAINKSGGDGIKMKVTAVDQITSREYRLQIRVHNVNPDSLVWTYMDKPLVPHALFDRLKAVLLGDDLLVYTSNTTFYQASTLLSPAAFAWQEKTASGLPADINFSSLINFKGQLYFASDSGVLYSSADGAIWGTVDTQGVKITKIITVFGDKLIGIGGEPGADSYFYASGDAADWTRGEIVPDGFPVSDYYTVGTQTVNNVKGLLLVGNTTTPGNSVMTWATQNGTYWVDQVVTSAACPYLLNPALINYGGAFYMFGGNFDTIYTSTIGLAWYPTRRYFLLPATMKGQHTYSMVIDNHNYIWVIIGQTLVQNPNSKEDGTLRAGGVWRGRLNKLGF